MIIWLINPYGPIPSENWRSYRFATMGKVLAQGGHDVIWWTSSFSHHFKRQRSRGWCDISAVGGFTIRLVPTPGYNRNIGFRRIWRDLVFAVRTYRRGLLESPRPDLIITSESPLTFGYAGACLGRELRCPVIHDQMDLWPELFEPVFPSWAKPIIHCILWPVYRYRRRFYRQLAGLVALAKPYLEVPLRDAPELRLRPHAVIYNGIDVLAFRRMMAMSDESLLGLPLKENGEMWVVFAGSLGSSYDIATILEASHLCSQSTPFARFIIAGDGPHRRSITDFICHHSGIRLSYLGHLPPKDLARLYRQSDVGLAAYTSRSNVEMPDKFYDYTAAGLPVVNSLQGEVREIIRDRELGLQYTAGDPASLADQINRLAADPQLYKRMVANAHRAAMDFDINRQYERFVSLVELVAKTTSGTQIQPPVDIPL